MEQNIVKVISKDDHYTVIINGVELKNITSLSLYKQSAEQSEITLTFDCILETKEQ